MELQMEPSGGEQEPGAVRLLDLPWEDVLLPHILSRVPLCQLLQLQRVSRAFRALVQLHLAGLRRFDAAQVSRGPEPRLQPNPQPLCLLFWTPLGLQECWGSDPPVESTLEGRVPGIDGEGAWGLSWEGC